MRDAAHVHTLHFVYSVVVRHENYGDSGIVDVTRWDEKAGLRRDAVGFQVIDVLEAQEIKETGNEEG